MPSSSCSAAGHSPTRRDTFSLVTARGESRRSAWEPDQGVREDNAVTRSDALQIGEGPISTERWGLRESRERRVERVGQCGWALIPKSGSMPPHDPVSTGGPTVYRGVRARPTALRKNSGCDKVAATVDARCSERGRCVAIPNWPVLRVASSSRDRGPDESPSSGAK